MSSSVPSKTLYPTNTNPPGKGFANWLMPMLCSSIGAKAITAVTGLLLTGFVIGHLVGNLKILAGQDGLNAYAKFLKDTGPLLWIARIGLLVMFAVHITIALWLKKKSVSARPVKYAYPGTIQATFASRTMPWTGAIILLFVIFHLAHYTLGMVDTRLAVSKSTGLSMEANYLELVDEQGRHDVYSMVIHGFRNPIIAAFYILCQLALMVHLSHGIASVFQTLGLNTPRIQPTVKKLALGTAAFVSLGNIALVVLVFAKIIPDVATVYVK